MASLAARTPHYEHEIKTKLLENAYTKWNHAWALSQTVNALGGPGDRIFNGPGTAWDALSYAWHLRNWQLLYAYHQPWPEGSAAFAVGIEALVAQHHPPAVEGLRAALRPQGRGARMAGLARRGGGMQRGNDGLFILEQKVPADDRAVQAQLRSGVHKTMLVPGEHWLDCYYRTDEFPQTTAA